MKLGEVVANVVSDLVKNGFPDTVPKVMSVAGGRDDVRREIAKKLYEETGSEVREGSNGVYNITLHSFIQRYDPSLC